MSLNPSVLHSTNWLADRFRFVVGTPSPALRPGVADESRTTLPSSDKGRVGKDAARAGCGLRGDPCGVHPAGNRYFTVNGADALTFSDSMSSFPLAPSS